MKKRVLSMALALALCLGLLPAGALALENEATLAATGATYSPKRLEAVVLPKKAADDRTFVRTKVRKVGSKFLMNNSFEYVKDSSRSVNRSGDANHDVLDPRLTFMHSSNNFWEAHYRWMYAGNYEAQKSVVLNELILARQLTVWAQAKLTPDVHSHVGDPDSHGKKIDRAQLVVKDHRNGVDVLKLQNGSNDGDGVGKVMEGSGVPSGTHYLGFRVKMSGTDCSCGSSKVSNVYIHLSDNSNPKIAGIYPSDANGEKTEKEYYKAGDTVWFTVSFTENIRFADDQLHNIALELNLIDNANGQTASVPAIEAGLDKLVDNKLIFSYTVPSDTPMDVRVGAVSPRDQDWVSAETPLAILGANGTILDSTTFKAASMITDLAGNPMEWVDSVTMEPKTVIDTKAPEVTRVTASASMMGDAKTTPEGEWESGVPLSAIWAGVGDSVSFSVTVNEEVGYHDGYKYRQFKPGSPAITGKLNLYNTNGDDPHKVWLTGTEYRMDSVNDGKISTVFHFSSQTVYRNMRLDGDYFRLTQLHMGYPLCDPSGNTFSLDLTNATPQEKFKLDVEGPTVSFENIEPSTDDAGTDVFDRVVPFTIADEGSGVDVEHGAFSAKAALTSAGDATVKCCVTDSIAKPDDSAFADEASFDYRVPGATKYLHIRVDTTGSAVSNLSIGYTVTAQDYAGNSRPTSATPEQRISINTDTSAPTIQIDKVWVNTGDGMLSAQVQVSDESTLQSVKYWWEIGDEKQPDVTVLAEPNGESTNSFTAKLEGLTGQAGSATLHVYAEDVHAKNVDKHSAEATSDPTAFDFAARKTKYSVGDNKTPTRTPQLAIEPPDDAGTEDAPIDMMTVVIMGPKNAERYNVYWVGDLGSSTETTILQPFHADPYEGGTRSLFEGSCDRPDVEAWERARTGGSDFVDLFNYTEGNPYNLPWEPNTTANGDVEVFLVTMPRSGVTTTKDKAGNPVLELLFKENATLEEPFTIACAMGRSYDVKVGTPVKSDGSRADSAPVADAETVPENPVQTLTGLTVPVALVPNASASFNFLDLDFAKGKVWLTDAEGAVLEGSEQALTPPEIGAETYTFNYLVSNELSGIRGHYKLHAEIPFVESLKESETAEFSADQWFYMDDEPFDDYYPIQYRQTYNLGIGDVNQELVLTDETTGEVTHISQVVAGLSDSLARFNVKAVRQLTFSATRNGELLPLQVWTGEKEPGNVWLPATDEAYVVDLKLGESDDVDSNKTLTLRAGDNRVYYRAKLPNGTVLPTRVLNVRTETKGPTFDLDFAAEAGTVSITAIPSDEYTAQQMDVTGNTLYIWDGSPKAIPLDGSRRTLVEYGPDSTYLAESNFYFVADSYGNVNVASCGRCTVAQNLDILPPTVTGETVANSLNGDAGYRVSLTLGDPTQMGPEQVMSSGLADLRISVAYQNADGEDMESTFTQSLPAAEDVPIRYSNGDGPFGLTEATLSVDEYNHPGKKMVSLLGVLPPDARAAGDKVFTVTVYDAAGNTTTYTGTLTLESAVPDDITFAQNERGGNWFISSSPVRLISPIEEEEMATNHWYLPFYESGTYTVEFMDPFGRVYTRDVEYVAPDYYTVEVSPSENPGMMSVTVTSTYAGTEGTGYFLCYALESDAVISDYYDYVKPEDGTKLPPNSSSFTVEVPANDSLYFWHDRGQFYFDEEGNLESYNSTNDIVRIGDVDETPADPDTPPVDTATIAWFDGEGNRLDVNGTVEEPVTGPVTALVECDDELTGDTRYIFPHGTAKGASHAFTFTDSLGNARTLTATLPWDVKAVDAEGEAIPADTAAPIYTAGLYQKNQNVWSQLTAFDSMLLGVQVDGRESPQSPANLSATMEAGRATQWQVAFSVEDESRTKMVVKLTGDPVTFESANDAGLPESLSVGASSLTWTGEAASPTLYISFVDSLGNKTAPLAVTFPGVYVPGKPTATVEYVKTGFTVRAYLVPVEDMDNYTVDNLEGVTLDEEANQYYHEFTENGSYTFDFTNTDSGLSASVTATVDSIDNRPMAVTNVSVIAAGKRRAATVADGAVTWDQTGVFTNANVALEVTTSLPIADAQVVGDQMGVSFGGNKATVVFLANTPNGPVPTLTLVGSNERTAQLTLPVITCIDRAAPGVTCTQGTITDGALTLPGTGKTRLTANFATDEPTDLNGKKTDETGTAHKYLVTQNGTYDLTFADRAGNVTKVALTVNDLDGKLTMEFSKNADGTAPTANPSRDWTGEAALRGNQKFYVRFTRAVTATLANGTRVECAKGDWSEFTVPEKGGLLTLKATNADGETVYTYLRSDTADTVPPSIHFDAGTIYAGADMTQAQREELLNSGVIVNGDDGKGFTTDAATAVNWAVAGRYTVTYTATDAAGNAAQAKRTLVVLPAGMPTIRINGESVAPFGTKVLPQRSFELALQGMSGKLFVSIKPGRLTQAQMKIGANVLLANKLYEGPISHGLGGPGFYTLYIRTQDRGGMLVYLYVTD